VLLPFGIVHNIFYSFPYSHAKGQFAYMKIFSNENKNCIRVDESWLDITDQMSKHSRQLSLTSLTLIKIWNQLKVDESWLDITDQMNKHSRQISLTLINIWNQLKVDECWLDITDQMNKHSRQLSLTLIKIWNQLKLMRVDWILLIKWTNTLVNSH
jgi:hypothetical protein